MALRTLGFISLVVSSVVAMSGCSSLGISMGNNRQNREFVMENSWSRTTLAHEFFGFRRLNRMQPLVLESIIVQSNAIDGIVAYDRATGAQLWRLNLENGVEGGAAAQGERLYFGSSDGQFYCVNVLTGQTLWTFPVRAETLAAPTVDEGVVYFQSGSDVVYALDAASGKQLWVYNRQVTTQLSIRATTKPVVHAGNVFVGFSDGFVVALKKRDGSLNWERKIGRGSRFIDVDATPVVYGDALYVASFDGSLNSLNVESGAVNWTVDQGAYVPVTLGRDRFADRLYYSTVNGEILTLDKRSGKQLAAFKLKKGIATQVALFRGLLLYGESEGALVVTNPDDGKQLARYEPGVGIVATPTVIDATGEAYVASVGANLYAFKLGYHRRGDRLPWQ